MSESDTKQTSTLCDGQDQDALLDFQKSQFAFAAHLRNPEINKAPSDVENRRMAIYRDLFYKNIEGFLSGTFPVLRDICNDEYWHLLVRGFFDCHRAHSPYFLEISEEFLAYLKTERVYAAKEPKFFYELAHYEWMELALDVAEDEFPSVGFNPEGDLLAAAPFVSPLSCIVSYQFPVHKIGPDFQPQTPLAESVFIVVYRTSEEVVRFMEINPLTARMLTLLNENVFLKGSELLEIIAAEASSIPLELVAKGGQQALESLRDAEVILGTRLLSVSD